MSRLAQDVQAARNHRDTVRADLDRQLAILKGDVAAKGVGARLMEDIAAKTSAGVSEAAEIASAHRSIIAGTIIALVLWFLRRPLIALALAQYAKWQEYRRDA